MAATHPASSDSARLSLLSGAVMVIAAVAVFAAAYAAGGVFGRNADGKLDGAGARVVAAVEPAGTPLLTVRTRSVAFDTQTITVPAAQPAQIRVENEDAGIFHNIAVYRDAQASNLVARGKLFDGPRTRDYRFEPFSAGAYYFQCDLHPAMSGTFIAE